ncbi:neural cell adhesion molecule 2-like isoform X3 [Littorina saxatilis]|uniref:neural cell adhesion molecule 2-like isoform X3 n=1 Tax=Littorina saxatilis TaxID=31220 RepID=UPI0038B6503C
MTAGWSEPVTFSCAAPDLTTTEADLKWFNDQDEEITATVTSGGKFISDSGRRLVLRIPNPTDDDAGTYTCRGVVNRVAKEGSITLELYRGINMTSPLTQYATQGSVAKIWCRMTKTNLEKDISWYHENWALIRSDDKYRVGYENGAGQEGDYLEIKDIQLDDGGKYICNIDMMSVGKTLANFIQVVVTVPPKMIKPITFNPVVPKEGDRLVMSCEASGTPRPTYMFRKNNQDLLEQPNTDGNYIIEKVNRTDEGLYQCEATNKGGSDTSDVTLDVKIPPVIETPDDQTKKTEQEGKEVRLQCRATGDPAPALTWQKKGSEIIYSVGTNDDVYVEEQEGNSEQDAQTRVYSKTLYLVIPTLKPKHAGEYVCTASTTAVTVDKTFKIDVMFKPNFDNQATTQFWGWVGSKTNLTCIANGNPEPVIEWHKEGQNLAAINDYIITNGNSGLPTRAISYLIPTVANGNVGSVFGSYSCKASNRFGENTEQLTFEQARVPGEVGITVQDTRATKLGLAITPPAEDGGQAVTQYLLKYNKLNNGGEEKSRTIDRVAGEVMTKVELEELDPNTQYSIKVYAINNVGSGAEKNFMERTADYSEPDRVMVKSPRSGANAYEYTLSWDVPMTGGADIANYVVEYAEALEVNTNTEPWAAVRVLPQAQTENIPGQASTSVVLDNLKKNTFYQAKIKAVNRIGTSDETTFIFRTGSGDGETKGQEGGPALGAGGIVGLMLVLLLVLALAVDAAFCKTKQCGLLWTLNGLIGRQEEGSTAAKSPEDGDEAAAKLLGKEKDDSLRTENEVAKETEATELESQEKKELEPEDKDEKPLPEPVVEEPVKAKTPTEAEATETAAEATPTVEITQPASDEKTDTTAKA